MRHHGPLSSEVINYSVSIANYGEFIKLYNEQIGDFHYKDLNRLLSFNPPKIESHLVNSENTASMMMYFFLVRILRLCDQKATENLKDYL